MHGKHFTAPVLRPQFDKAWAAASMAASALAKSIKDFRFYDLRAKAGATRSMVVVRKLLATY